MRFYSAILADDTYFHELLVNILPVDGLGFVAVLDLLGYVLRQLLEVLVQRVS